jgi:Uma2 family endonuclease
MPAFARRCGGGIQSGDRGGGAVASTSADDFAGKLADYFRVPSALHYLIVRARRREVIHHHRGEGGVVVTRMHTAGIIRLDPPGISIAVEEIYGD